MPKYRVTIKTEVDLRYEFEHTYHVTAGGEDEAEKVAYKKARESNYDGLCDVTCEDDVLIGCREIDRATEVLYTEENDGNNYQKLERLYAPKSLLGNTGS